MTVPPSEASVVCIGAGPACLTAAYLLSKASVEVVVLERDNKYVGGISKTVNYRDFLFDIGGHRFFSKSKRVEDLWKEILGPDLVERPRKSRIYYRGRLFSYPLRPFEALRQLGAFEAVACVASYLKSKLFPVAKPKNFEDWVSNQFGRRLFRIFFKSYTEKVWGMKCTEISVDWAAQRIKGLSLAKAVLHALLPRQRMMGRQEVIKTLISSFLYPRRGPGMMWDAAAKKISEMGGAVCLGHNTVSVTHDSVCGKWTVVSRDCEGRDMSQVCDHVISSTSLKELFEVLRPPASRAAMEASRRLRYRDFLVVALILKERNLFDDNWIYIHDPSVGVGRVQNFKSWSPELVPDPALNCYGLEYFCFEGDELWRSPDADLIAMASAEIVKLGLAYRGDVVDGHVVRQRKAYPVYDDHYQDCVEILRKELKLYPNLHLVGRNGMHKYNNQDHAMMTAMLTVDNLLSGSERYDVWRVNQDAEYHETVGH